VTPKDEAGYRVTLAEMRLRSAEESLRTGRWADAAFFARAAVENAAKAILACFQTVPRTHEPVEVLRTALGLPAFPPAAGARARALLPSLERYGLARHLELSYGDERNFVSPEALVSEPDARLAVADAGAVLRLATDVRRAVLGP
jgi:HEPN domain-containing protein